MAKVTGGDKLALKLGDMSKALQNASSVDVGWPVNDTYPDGTSIPKVAAIQEYGAPKKGIPPRPYFRTMIAKKSPEWPDAISKALVKNKYDARKTLNQLGLTVEGQLQDSIVDMNSPPLSPVTIMLRSMKNEYEGLPFYDKMKIAIARVHAGKSAKGASEKPLVDTGVLLNSIKHVVK